MSSHCCSSFLEAQGGVEEPSECPTCGQLWLYYMNDTWLMANDEALVDSIKRKLHKPMTFVAGKLILVSELHQMESRE